MRISFENDRVLAVVAHPDDAELLCAGTLARAAADGAAIGVCVLCQGDKGVSSRAPENLADIRRGEMQSAAELLGAELLTGEVPDGALADDPPTRRLLTELVRRFRPTLLLAHWPGDYHPDHQAAGKLAEAASWFCASRGQATDSAPLAAPPALWWMDTVGLTGFEPQFFIDVSGHADLKERLLACHASQLDRGGDRDFTPLLDLLRRQMHTRGAQAGAAAAEAFRAHQAFKRARAW
ncbi:MAG: PIG-L deacetylase family protein, partial [Planctomycetaceae bacterium]